jgi:hypothetical protein
VPAIYLGHDFDQNCAVVHLLESAKVIRSRDVDFREGSFTHAAALQAGNVQSVLARGYYDADAGEEPAAAGAATPSAAGAEAQGGPAPAAEAQGGQQQQQQQAALQQEHASSSEDSGDEYDVERITDRRGRGRGLRYKVKWVGYPEEESSWLPVSRLHEARELVKEFEQRRRAPTDSPQAADSAELGEAESASVHMVMGALRSTWTGRAAAHAITMPLADPQLALAIAAGVGLLEHRAPATYREAMSCPETAKWQAAMDKEFQSCEQQQTWTLVRRADLPRGANVGLQGEER